MVITNYCNLYLKWFYDIFLKVYLEKEVSCNSHFKTQIIETLQI
jgi:hypothetical protein